MVFVKSSFFSIFVVLMTSTDVRAAEILTPQEVVDAVLQKSYKAERIKYSAQESYINLEKTKGLFDLQLTMSANQIYDEAESYTNSTNVQTKSLYGDIGFAKKNYLGTSFQVGYLHQTANILKTADSRTNYVQDAGYLQIRQSLWNNLFGKTDRLNVEIAEREVQESEINKQEQTENLVMTALRAYWDTYVAQTQLKDALDARQKYQSLITAVQKRGRFGLDKGGEYAQVMAEATEADINVKKASLNYINLLDNLSLLIKKEFKSDVQFKVEPLIPAIPKLQDIGIDQLRVIRNAQSQYDTAVKKLDTAKVSVAPKLDLVGKATTTGYDELASSAYSEFASGKKPTYYVGIEFATPLDSSSARASLASAQLDISKKNLNLNELKEDTQNNLRLYTIQLEQAYTAATGSEESEKYRSRTVKEQEVEYRQGRLPLRDLLKTYKDYFDSQARKVRAIGDYHITLNLLAAQRDELVK